MTPGTKSHFATQVVPYDTFAIVGPSWTYMAPYRAVLMGYGAMLSPARAACRLWLTLSASRLLSIG